MTNLEVLRAVQHVWPSYCWPFANGNSYALATSSPSPPSSISPSHNRSMDDSKSDSSFSEQESSCYEKPSKLILNCSTSSSVSPHKMHGLKNERLTPETPISSNSDLHNSIHTVRANKCRSAFSPSPSASPKSHSSNRTRTPSLSGTPPHPGFTSPISLSSGYFGPASSGIGGVGGNLSLINRAGQTNFMETTLPRNCSDLMRSLAAKYNNGGSSNNDTMNNQVDKGHSRNTTNQLLLGKTPHLAINSDGALKTSLPSEFQLLATGQFQSRHSNVKNNKIPPPLLPTNLSIQSGQNLSSTKALIDMVRNATANQGLTTDVPSSFGSIEYPSNAAMKRAAETSSPLDLSSSMSVKRAKCIENESNETKNGTCKPQVALLPKENNIESILSWSVEEVSHFLRSIDLCAEYADMFKEQKIDGWSLSLLTESHLTTHLKMKLGPALKLRSILATSKARADVNKTPCSNCSHQLNNINNNSMYQKEKRHLAVQSSHLLPKEVSPISSPSAHYIHGEHTSSSLFTNRSLSGLSGPSNITSARSSPLNEKEFQSE